MAVRPTPHGVGLGRVGGECKPKAVRPRAVPCWTRRPMAVRPTPHGVGLGRVGGECKPTGRKAAGKPRWMRRLLAVRPTPHGVGLGRVGGKCKPTGRKAAGKPRWARRLLAVRPTPHGVGLGRVGGECKPTGRKAAGSASFRCALNEALCLPVSAATTPEGIHRRREADARKHDRRRLGDGLHLHSHWRRTTRRPTRPPIARVRVQASHVVCVAPE